MRKAVIVLDSSPGKSWSENNDSYDGSGLSNEPVGPETERRETTEEPPAEMPQCRGRRSRQRHKQAHLWPHRLKMVKDGEKYISRFFHPTLI